MIDTKYPNLNYEYNRITMGDRYICGVDEVGRGAWAGPLSVGAVLIDLTDRRVLSELVNLGINDSKKLSPKKRLQVFNDFKTRIVSYSIAHLSNKDCEEVGMSLALKLAANQAVESLAVAPDHIFVDGPVAFVGKINQTNIVRGDSKSIVIAAASIAAKVTRDKLMQEYSLKYPEYGFDKNKGYPSKFHIKALQTIGPCDIHRTRWKFMQKIYHYEC